MVIGMKYMYFKAQILSNFISIINILDTFTWYFMLQMITRALELKEERKDAKRRKNEKEGLNAMALDWKNSQNW